MPYLASNRDAREQDGFKTGLMLAATIALVGGTAAAGRAYKNSNLGKATTPAKVANRLYGKNGNQITRGALENINVVRPSDIADSGMHTFRVNTNRHGVSQVIRDDGNFIQNMASRFDPNVKAFNKQLRDYAGGKNELYATSKLTSYQGLMNDAQKYGIGVNSDQVTNMVNRTHATPVNQAIRDKNPANFINGHTDANDAMLSSSIWERAKSVDEAKDMFGAIKKENRTKMNQLATDTLTNAKELSEKAFRDDYVSKVNATKDQIANKTYQPGKFGSTSDILPEGYVTSKFKNMEDIKPRNVEEVIKENVNDKISRGVYTPRGSTPKVRSVKSADKKITELGQNIINDINSSNNYIGQSAPNDMMKRVFNSSKINSDIRRNIPKPKMPAGIAELAQKALGN